MEVERKSVHGKSRATDERDLDGTSGPDSNECQDPAFLKLLPVDLVVEELLRNLTFEDAKALSLVSWDALIAVRKTTFFSRRAQLRICRDTIFSGVLNNCFYSWKHVKLVRLADGDLQQIGWNLPKSSVISQSLSSVQSLSYEEGGRDIHLDYSEKIKDFVLGIINSSKETLKDLEVNVPNLCLEGIESIHCPNLRRLDLCVFFLNFDGVVEAFLKNLPPLKELSVASSCPSKLLASLKGRMSNLQKFQITIYSNECDTPVTFGHWYRMSIQEKSLFFISRISSSPCEFTPPQVDWNMMSDMTKLEDISILLDHNDSTRSAQDIGQLLCRIPAETVTKMEIHDSLETDPSGTRFCLTENASESISRFTNLTELSLVSLVHFDNARLQGIIKACLKLKKLSLVNLSKVGDFGFSGVESSPTEDPLHLASNERGVPLTNLRDLVTLTIDQCGVIFPATLLDIIRFEFLTSVKFHGLIGSWDQLLPPRNFLLQILQQNPTLNKVNFRMSTSLHSYPRRDNALENELTTLFPQIEQLEFAYNRQESVDMGEFFRRLFQAFNI